MISLYKRKAIKEGQEFINGVAGLCFMYDGTNDGPRNSVTKEDNEGNGWLKIYYRI